MTKPLLIGITGHRDPRPRAVAGLRQQLAEFYCEQMIDTRPSALTSTKNVRF